VKVPPHIANNPKLPAWTREGRAPSAAELAAAHAATGSGRGESVGNSLGFEDDAPTPIKVRKFT
jgi:hypothetical protein